MLFLCTNLRRCDLLLRHIAKNRFWVITGLELVTIAFMFSIRFLVLDAGTPKSFSIVSTPAFQFVTVAVSVAMIIQSLWDLSYHFIREITRLLAVGVTTMMMMAFWLSDLSTLHITLVPIGLMFLLIRMLLDLATDNTLFKNGKGQ